MFCPSCGQEQVTEDTRFCSRCGLLLTGISTLIYNGGALPQAFNKKKFYQKKGFKQGLFIFLLSFIIVPLLLIFAAVVNVAPFAALISLILLVGGGFLRMAYSLMFEADETDMAMLGQANRQASRNYLGNVNAGNALPPPQSTPISGYVPPKQGNWRDTNDLSRPSVTEGTTKLFGREE